MRLRSLNIASRCLPMRPSSGLPGRWEPWEPWDRSAQCCIRHQASLANDIHRRVISCNQKARESFHSFPGLLSERRVVQSTGFASLARETVSSFPWIPLIHHHDRITAGCLPNEVLVRTDRLQVLITTGPVSRGRSRGGLCACLTGCAAWR